MKTKLILVNLLSLSRYVAAILIPFRVLENDWFGALLLIIWGFGSDITDGYAARKYGICTRFGNFVDLTADVLLDIAIIASLAMKDIIPWAPAAALIAILSLMRVHGLIGKPAGSLWGKVSAVAVVIYTPAIWLVFVPFYVFKAFGMNGVLAGLMIGVIVAALLYKLEKDRVEEWKARFMNGKVF